MRGISWIASYPKSGNTWLRLFLGCYRNLGVPLHPNALPADMESADISDQHYWAVSPAPFDKLTREEVLQLRGAALLHIMASAYARPLFCKTHWRRCNFEHVEIFPPALSAPSVYIVRDPRDVAVSFAEWQAIPIDEMIAKMSDTKCKLGGVNYETLISYLGSWSEHVESWIAREDTLVIRYEDALAQPAEIFAGVLAHVGLPIDEDRVRRAAAETSFAKLRALEDKGRFVETGKNVDRFFNRGFAGYWREALTAEQAAKIEADHGRVMAKMGYLDEHSERAA